MKTRNLSLLILIHLWEFLYVIQLKLEDVTLLFNIKYREIVMRFSILFRKKTNIIGNICDLLERYFDFLNEYEKLYAKEFDSKNENYRDINQKGKKLIKLTINFIRYQFMNSC